MTVWTCVCPVNAVLKTTVALQETLFLALLLVVIVINMISGQQCVCVCHLEYKKTKVFTTDLFYCCYS